MSAPGIADVLSGAARWHVECGDALAVLRTLPDASIDALVADPPAGIAFMGREWDHDKGGRDQWIAWLASILRECLRVLRPGGHALVWALPRTSHWTGMACEDAGFEVRDRLSHLFGSGFPKSLNVSAALDRAAGAVREVVGKSARHGGGHCDGASFNVPAEVPMLTAPATDAARQWQGWGTALKPAVEDWWLCRKPIVGTVAANVQRFGTGAINVDATRVRFASGADKAAAAAAASQRAGQDQNAGRTAYGRFENGPDSVAPYIANLDAGRWPPNLLLSHAEGCRPVGTRKVAGAHPSGLAPGEVSQTATDTFRFGGGRKTADGEYVGPDGTETVEAWDCAPAEAVEVPAFGFAGITVSMSEGVDRITSFLGLVLAALRLSDSRTVGTQSRQSCVPARVHLASSPAGFPDDCPVCCRSCGGPARLGAELDQSCAPQLGDVLEYVLGLPCLSSHSPAHQHVGPRSSSDASPVARQQYDMSRNNRSVPSRHRVDADETDARTSDMVSAETPLCAPVSSSERSNTVSGGTGAFVLPSRTACNDSELRRLLWMCLCSASRLLPITVTSERAIVNGCPVAELDRQSGESVSSGGGGIKPGIAPPGSAIYCGGYGPRNCPDNVGYGDTGAASRFFPTFRYCAKASRAEREDGCGGLSPQRGPTMNARCVNCGHGMLDGRRDGPCCDSPRYENAPPAGNVRNHHPTVKSDDLMRWLVRLVTPPDGIVLDCFAGSGSTGRAALLEGFRFLGIEREPEYVEIARARILAAVATGHQPALPGVAP